MPPSLRLLKGLVTVLTVVMILGVIIVVGLLVTRLQTPRLATPEMLQMPAGAVAHAVTQGPDFWAVVTRDGRILIFDGTGALTQEVAVISPN